MMDKELIGNFIDAAVRDQNKAAEMLRQCPELRDARWIHRETVLRFLAVEGYADGVRFLAAQGFDVNAVNEFGDAPLIDVATLGNEESAQTLLQFGADPNAVSDTAENVVHAAIRSGNAPLVDLLLSAGARADSVQSWTLFNADSDSLKQILAVLKKHGVEVTM